MTLSMSCVDKNWEGIDQGGRDSVFGLLEEGHSAVRLAPVHLLRGVEPLDSAEADGEADVASNGLSLLNGKALSSAADAGETRRPNQCNETLSRDASLKRTATSPITCHARATAASGQATPCLLRMSCTNAKAVLYCK